MQCNDVRIFDGVKLKHETLQCFINYLVGRQIPAAPPTPHHTTPHGLPPPPGDVRSRGAGGTFRPLFLRLDVDAGGRDHRSGLQDWKLCLETLAQPAT